MNIYTLGGIGILAVLFGALYAWAASMVGWRYALKVYSIVVSAGAGAFLAAYLLALGTSQ